MEKKILQMAEAIEALGPGHQWFLLKTLFAGFGIKKRIQWFNWVCCLTYPKEKWRKLERWMEGMFRRDMKRTPRMVASMGANYLKININMMPFLIKMAQRVKHRVRMRIRNHPERSDGQE